MTRSKVLKEWADFENLDTDVVYEIPEIKLERMKNGSHLRAFCIACVDAKVDSILDEEDLVDFEIKYGLRGLGEKQKAKKIRHCGA